MLSWLKREQSRKHSESTEQPQYAPFKQAAEAESAFVDFGSSSPSPVQPLSSALGVHTDGHSNVQPLVESIASAEPIETKRRAFTAAVSHPHDSVIAELHGHHPDHDVSARIDATARARSFIALQSADTLPTAPSSEAPGASPALLDFDRDKLFDPFSGNPLGTFLPAPTASQAREELWTHLGRIRELQADIAQMHVTMEGVGLGDKAGAPASRPRERRPRTRSGAGERLDLGVGEGELEGMDGVDEVEMREERDQEFEAADAKFDGRREGIGKIMGKLGELAQALATFHALETPATDFGSRSNAVSSHTESGMLSPHTSPVSPTGAGMPPLPVSASPTALTPPSGIPFRRYDTMRRGSGGLVLGDPRGNIQSNT